MEIYGEYFFLENWIANAIIIWLVARIWKKPLGRARLLAAAALSALYAFGIFSPKMALLYHPAVKLLFSWAMMRFTFGRTSLLAGAKLVLTFYGAGFLLGGAVAAFLYFTSTAGTVSSGAFYFDKLTYASLLAALGGSLCLLRALLGIFSQRRERNRLICPVKLQAGGRQKPLVGLVDTGNFLREPVTGLPVVVGQAEAVREFFPLEEGAEKTFGREAEGKKASDERERQSLYVIPYATVGTRAGAMLGIRAQLEGPGGWRECVLALCGESLSQEEDCQLILPRELAEVPEEERG